jgi:deoxyribose-phosphate aldolase
MRTFFDPYAQTPETIANRVADFKGAILPPEMIRLLPGMLDMTTLEGSDTEEKVRQLCRKARFSVDRPGVPDAAAVCVYPSLVRTAGKALEGTGIRVASVAGGFPAGQTALQIKLEEIRWAILEGAAEIDTVISRGKLIEGRETEVYDELAAMRDACGDAHLKVILETGELPSVAMVRRASEIALLAGADFIKTSTGKISRGAEPESFLVMLDTIREYHEKTGKAAGIKAAGGVRTAEEASLFALLVIEVLGEQWFDPEFFRIGASSLAEDLLKRI